MLRRSWFGTVLGLAAFVLATGAQAQMVSLSAGFQPDPRTMGGMAGGPVSARTFGPQCSGWIPVQPQHRMVLATTFPFLRVWAGSGGDTTLVVRAPNGQVFCADDTWGDNPGVDILGAMPGAYEVYVGTFNQGQGSPYTVGFSESRTSSPAPQAQAMPPANPCGGGGVAMPPGNPCGGGGVAMPPQNPCGGGGAIAMPPGNPCGGGEPGIAMPPSGGYGYPLASGFLPDPRILSGVSGGPIQAQSMNASCRGWMNTQPNHLITLTSPFSYLRMWVRSSGDTTIMLRAPTGQVFCADDTWGLNPGVDLNGLPPGTYQVFVGSYSSGQSYPYQLGLTENPQSTPNAGIAAPIAPSGPDVAPMNYGAVSLTSGFLPDPQVRGGVSGGPVSAMSLNASCRGYIGVAPDHVLYLNSPFNFLRVYVQSQADTTLFVRGPHGEVWCSDDVWGFNPGIDLRFAPPGSYQIYVGSYSAGNSQPYSIGFTENPGMHP